MRKGNVMKWTVTLILSGLLMAIWTMPTLAADLVIMDHDWGLSPESSVSHPKKQKLTMVATEGMDLVICELWYQHERWRLSDEAPMLDNGGKVIAILKVVNQSGTHKIGKQKKKVETQTPGGSYSRGAYLGWSDRSGYVCKGCPIRLRHKPTTKLPIRVEPGDLLIWKVKFRGIPRLQVEASFHESIRVLSRCRSCGSVDYPCPVPH